MKKQPHKGKHMIAAVLPIAGFAGSTMVKGIGKLYGVAGDMNTWTDKHIQGMQKSSNQTIICTGKVLEGAKFGFGIGYLAPVTVIAIGQVILGNTLDAAITVASAMALSNPFAMTCAAVGAIYFGWGALSDQERNEILAKISAGMEVGIEFIKSVVNFIISNLKEMLGSKNLTEIKKAIRDGATEIGRKLSDITCSLADRIAEANQSAKRRIKILIRRVKGTSQATETTTTKTTKGIKKA